MIWPEVRACAVAIVAVLAACPADRPGAERAEKARERLQELVPVEFELPKPGVHNDSEIWAIRALKPSVHRESIPHRAMPHPPLLAPKGTRNVVLKKPVTSSDNAPLIGELAQVTDGDKRCSLGSCVELAHGPQWVQIDLQGKYDIHAILFWHWFEAPRYYHDVVVEVADDPKFAANVRTVFNNDYDNSLGRGKGSQLEYPELPEGKLISCKGITARYVRLYSRGNVINLCNHYIEVEVHGTPAQ